MKTMLGGNKERQAAWERCLRFGAVALIVILLMTVGGFAWINSYNAEEATRQRDEAFRSESLFLADEDNICNIRALFVSHVR
jgi:hypothetical protein